MDDSERIEGTDEKIKSPAANRRFYQKARRPAYLFLNNLSITGLLGTCNHFLRKREDFYECF